MQPPSLVNKRLLLLTLCTLGSCGPLLAQQEVGLHGFEKFDRTDAVPDSVWDLIIRNAPIRIGEPGEEFNKGCRPRAGYPQCRMNWAGSDPAGSWLISLTCGGYAVSTNLSYVEVSDGKLVRRRYRGGEFSRALSFEDGVNGFRSGSLERLDR